MPTHKHKSVFRKNVAAARRAWERVGSPSRARPAAAARARVRANLRTGGDFYHVEVRPKGRFRSFRTEAVGRRAGIECISGRRPDGRWEPQKWLIGKEHAHVEDGVLVPDTADVRRALGALESAPHRVRGDRFKSAPKTYAGKKRLAKRLGRKPQTEIALRRARRRARASAGRPRPPGAPRA
jgi:hypothetical protein